MFIFAKPKKKKITFLLHPGLTHKGWIQMNEFNELLPTNTVFKFLLTLGHHRWLLSLFYNKKKNLPAKLKTVIIWGMS